MTLMYSEPSGYIECTTIAMTPDVMRMHVTTILQAAERMMVADYRRDAEDIYETARQICDAIRD